MTQRRVRAVYMRGGTSRCLCFHAEDLPEPGRERDSILLAALGSPDPYGRQLDGLGGGISSLSKACIVGPGTLVGADVDYTFAQVDVKTPLVAYVGNCGNCASAIGPFAIDEKLIVAHVPVKDGEAAIEGDFELPGVPGRGARIALDFLDPGGAVTGRLLPTGHARDVVDGVEASLVDATNPIVFVRARDLGLTGAESPAAVDADRGVSERLEKIRTAAARVMGIPPGPSMPKVAFVAPSAAFTTLDGKRYAAGDADVLARVISMGNCHRAFALTAAMCLAVAAQIDGTVVHECATNGTRSNDIRLAHPSGVLPIAAGVRARDGAPWAERVTVYRTARRLMEGFVRVP